METARHDRRRVTVLSLCQIITRQEYEALMSELAQRDLAEPLPPISDVAETVKRLEFNLMILVGLILAVVMFMLNN